MTRFVLVSQGRAGAQFILNNLDAHPDVMLGMDPFHTVPATRTAVDGHRWEVGTSATEFAFQHIWTGQKPVEGFKLFCFHCREDALSADIWDHLRTDRDVKFIFLNRRNLLMKHISELRAEASGVIHPVGPDYLQAQFGQQVAIQVTLPVLRRELFEHYAGFNRVAEIFAAHDCLYLSYEDLVINAEGCYAEILRFLGLASQALVDPFKPGTLTPETTKVINGPAVRRFMARSIWADYLDNCPLV